MPASDYDCQKDCGEKFERIKEEKYLISWFLYGTILSCDITNSLLLSVNIRARDQKEVRDNMNKYELAVVVSAKVEDEVRLATIEQVKEYVTRFGGTITNVDEWGKKRLAYEI